MNKYCIIIGLLIIFYFLYKIMMSKKTFKDFLDTQSAIFYTILWIFLVVIIFPLIAYMNHTGVPKFSLSVLGAYLSGVAAPIAFFWLVLGYFQQAKQLQVNNETLKLQLEEFKHSVDAQILLADNTHKQLDFFIQEKYYPDFQLSLFEKHDNTLEFTVVNKGTPVKNILWNVNNALILEDPLITKVDDSEVQMNLLFENLAHISSLDLRLMVAFNINYDQETRYLCYNISYVRTALTPLTTPEMVKISCKPVE